MSRAELSDTLAKQIPETLAAYRIPPNMSETNENPKKTKREKVFAVLPTMLTLGNAICGFGAITILARVAPNLDVVGATSDPVEQMFHAAMLLFAAMLFDALDGSAARLTNQTSEFGAMLDSLCDVVSFGVAPAFMMLKLNHALPQLADFSTPFDYHYPINFLWSIAALFMACAILRLARFNVETDEEDTHEGFSGLPSPAAAGVIAAFPISVWGLKKNVDTTLESVSPQAATDVTTTPAADVWEPLADFVLPAVTMLLPWITLATAVLMVSRIQYPHVATLILKGRQGRRMLLQVLFTLPLVFLLYDIAIPVIFCWFAFAGPVKAVWNRYVMRPKPASENAE